MTIADNIQGIRERIHVAAARAGRDGGAITLMAVSKTFPAAAIRAAYEAGLRTFGENRVQEFAAKAGELRELRRVSGQRAPDRASLDARAKQLHREALEEEAASFHLIGHLQSNKAAKAVELFDAVDSVDSARLAARLNTAAAEAKRRLDVLLEVNIGSEAAKSGLPPDINHAEFQRLLQELPGFEHLRVRGLMCIPPHTDDPDGARPSFRRMRELRDAIAALHLPNVEMTTLSMGMSHDFEVAIEEGSTCVRLGTAVFGARPKP